MDTEARGALIGMCLGDGHINVRYRLKDGKYRFESAEMRILHGPAQYDYCLHKAGLVKKYLGGKFNVRPYKNGPGGEYQSFAFSASNKYFKLLKKWIYPGGKKTYTKFVLDMLTQEGIALWYMDDGHARVNVNKDGYVSSVSTSIATMCSRPEVDDIIQWFDAKHGITFKPRFDKRMADGHNWFIEANTENSRWFAHLVLPYIIPSMIYKMAHVADLNSHERRTPVGVWCSCPNILYDTRLGGLCTACYSRRYRKQTQRAMI